MSRAESAKVPLPDINAPVKQKKKLLNGPHFTFTYPNGSVYEGAFKDGKLHGFGKYKYLPSGDFYEGEWKADMKHGHGRYVFAGGDHYIGTWYMGKKHGKGKFSFASGDEYCGNWQDDVMHGYGVFRLEQNGDQYEGYWERGLRSGAGVLRKGSGSVYDGEWAAGSEDGFGVLQEVSDSVYCGTWKAGLKDGKGVEKEGGSLFLVEYLGGYLISKQALPAGTTPQDDDWKIAVRHLSQWSCPPPLTSQPSGIRENIGADAADALKRTVDSWREAYLALYQRVYHEPSGDVKPSGTCPSEEQTLLDLRSHAEVLKGRSQLLEAALGERMLEGRRLQAALRGKDATIQDLKLHLAQVRGERKRAPGPRDSIGDAHADSPLRGDEEGQPASDRADAASLIEELKKQNVALTQSSYGQQQKLAVLSADNAKLRTELSAMEDAVRELEEKLAAADQGCVATKGDASGRSGAAMAEAEVLKELARVRESNAELLVKASLLQDELASARAETTDLSVRLRASEQAYREAVKTAAAKVGPTKADHTPFLPAPLPDWRADTESVAVNTKAAVNGSLMDKEKQVAQLQRENAELARLLDEYRFQVDSKAKEEHEKKKHDHKRRLPKPEPIETEKSTAVDSAELSKAEAELKKSRKKLKRMVEERNDLAVELYNAQRSFARLNRLLLHLRGDVVVAVVLPKDSPGTAGGASLVRVNDTDSGLLEVPSASKSYHFDVCCPSPVIPEHLFLEVKAPLAFVAQGFQSAFVGLGGRLAGSPNVLTSLLPFLLEGVRAECSRHEKGRGDYVVAYSVAAAEIDASGARDCFSGRQLSKVTKSDHGYAQPDGITFLDCGGDRVLDLLRQPLGGHTKDGALSHLWMQLRVSITHRMEQTTRCGRLTLFDLSGLSSADQFEGFDPVSTRFMKRSHRLVDETLRALRGGTGTVPYAASVETSLLYDLLGGNSMTTVLGSLPAGGEELKERLVAGLESLESLTRLSNSPLLQDYVGADELRWRDIVAAVSSAEQALPSADVVENVTL